MANLATASLASATGTRTDSACKHIRVCRVSQDYICNWIGMTLQDLKSNKYKYAVQRDDPFIACGAPLFTANACFSNHKPYAIGLGNLTDINIKTKTFLAYMHHACQSYPDFEFFRNIFEAKMNQSGEYDSKTQREIAGIPDFYFGGIALTNGFPHGGIADTALSVLTGGMQTVQNGPFDINAGDICTWVWSFELSFFTPKGLRKKFDLKDETTFTNIAGLVYDRNITFDRVIENLVQTYPHVANEEMPKEEMSSKRRRLFFDEQMLRVNKNSYNNEGKKNSYPVIIPLRHGHRWADRRRVFGICLMSARANEKTDIMICRQGM